MISGLPGFVPASIRIKNLVTHDYSIERNPTASSLNSYDRNNPELIKQVEATRRLVQESFFEEISFSKIGVKLSTLTPSNSIIDSYVRAEADTLKVKLDEQLSYLGVNKDKPFSLTQKNDGTLSVTGEMSTSEKNAISTKINASKHFQETFHLLKTAEKVLQTNSFNNKTERLNFTVNLSAQGVEVDVSKQALGQGEKPSNITNEELYNLARYGIAARKTETFYLGHPKDVLYKK